MSEEKIKYNIVDMYWLINNKLFNQQPLEIDPIEAGFCSIGYNADFNNLRVGFYDIGDGITRTSINKDKMKLLTTINIFSETANRIINEFEFDINNFERIIGASNAWQPNLTKIVGTKKEIIIKTMTPEEKKYMFTFNESHIPILTSAFAFMTNGNSWNNYLQIKK